MSREIELGSAKELYELFKGRYNLGEPLYPRMRFRMLLDSSGNKLNEIYEFYEDNAYIGLDCNKISTLIDLGPVNAIRMLDSAKYLIEAYSGKNSFGYVGVYENFILRREGDYSIDWPIVLGRLQARDVSKYLFLAAIRAAEEYTSLKKLIILLWRDVTARKKIEDEELWDYNRWREEYVRGIAEDFLALKLKRRGKTHWYEIKLQRKHSE